MDTVYALLPDVLTYDVIIGNPAVRLAVERRLSQLKPKNVSLPHELLLSLYFARNSMDEDRQWLRDYYKLPFLSATTVYDVKRENASLSMLRFKKFVALLSDFVILSFNMDNFQIRYGSRNTLVYSFKLMTTVAVKYVQASRSVVFATDVGGAMLPCSGNAEDRLAIEAVVAMLTGRPARGRSLQEGAGHAGHG